MSNLPKLNIQFRVDEAKNSLILPLVVACNLGSDSQWYGAHSGMSA